MDNHKDKTDNNITEINGIAIPDHLMRTPERMEKIKEVSCKRRDDLTIVLENIHDPHNISACIRSCDAVGISEIHVINTIAPKPYRRLGKKTSGGSIKWVSVKKWKSVDSCYDYLRNEGFSILSTALSDESVPLYDLNLTHKTALVFGNEHDGLTEEAATKADANYTIPQLGMIESLNISVACAVSLFEAMRQKEIKGHYKSTNIPKSKFKNLLFKMLERR